MIFETLRHVADAEVHARKAMASWPLHDATLAQKMTYAPLPTTEQLVAVEAYRNEICWCGFIDLSEWLMYTAPDLAGLAYQTRTSSAQQLPGPSDHVRHLFEVSARPITMPLPALAYEHIRIRTTVPRQSPWDCLLSVMTPQGRIWLSEYPAIASPSVTQISASVRSVSLSIAWCLGFSTASRRLVSALRRGDVLLIKNETFELTSCGQKIGRFAINEHGEISMQAESYNDEIQPEDDTGEISEDSIDTTLSEIPLRLDFILQRRIMTVAQIDTLYRGQVIQLDPQVEQKIEIVVNGARIAKGELVELNGRLGVELHDISVGQHLHETNRVQ